MQLAAALPLGFTSECEIADIWLLEKVDPRAAGQAMLTRMAPGIEIKDVREVNLANPALQNQVIEADYVARITEAVDPVVLLETITQFLAAESIMRERRGKHYDLRPLVISLVLADDKDNRDTAAELELQMRLSMTPGKTGRPDEVLDALDLDPLAALIHRRRLLLADE